MVVRSACGMAGSIRASRSPFFTACPMRGSPTSGAMTRPPIDALHEARAIGIGDDAADEADGALGRMDLHRQRAHVEQPLRRLRGKHASIRQPAGGIDGNGCGGGFLGDRGAFRLCRAGDQRQGSDGKQAARRAGEDAALAQEIETCGAEAHRKSRKHGNACGPVCDAREPCAPGGEARTVRGRNDVACPRHDQRAGQQIVHTVGGDREDERDRPRGAQRRRGQQVAPIGLRFGRHRLRSIRERHLDFRRCHRLVVGVAVEIDDELLAAENADDLVHIRLNRNTRRDRARCS